MGKFAWNCICLDFGTVFSFLFIFCRVGYRKIALVLGRRESVFLGSAVAVAWLHNFELWVEN